PRRARGIVGHPPRPGRPDGGPPPAPPPAVAPPSSPVTVLGLSMRSQSRERALTLWSTVLQGRVTEKPGGTLRFSWPGSFMRIDVEPDHVQNEGPIAIELAPSS